MQSFGATAGAMVQYAAMAVMAGMAQTVVCVFADAPLREGRATGGAYDGSRWAPEGWRGLLTASGIGAANTMYALAARRHMARYGTTSEQFGHVAVAQRQWAALNPLAQMRDPITLEDHQSSRWVAEPLHLLDCCLVCNGGVAVIVTIGRAGAPAWRQPPVHVLGWAQAHPGPLAGRRLRAGLGCGDRRPGGAGDGRRRGSTTSTSPSSTTATPTRSWSPWRTTASAPRARAAPSPPAACSGPVGSSRVNTGGGELSGYYLWGMTPLSEAVIQARGQGGTRQVEQHDVVLVSGNGGVLDHHATLVFGTAAAAMSGAGRS